jgi:hypothetical protein
VEKYMGRIFVNLAGVVIGLIAFWYISSLFTTAQSDFGFTYRGREVSEIVFGAIALTTLVGVLMGTLYDFASAERSKRTTWWHTFRVALQTPRFGAAMLVSPILVFFVFDQIYDREFDFRLLVFAFQNGFFWERAVKMILRRSDPVPSSISPSRNKSS